jgi:hypothetical protein
LELEETWTTGNITKAPSDIKSLRPNDKVNVRWNTGKLEYDVKWKKVEEQIKKGEGVIF